jgi:sugar phosphate permease
LPWESLATSRPVELAFRLPDSAPEGVARPMIVYLLHLAAPRVGTESDDVIIRDFLAAGYLVATLTYAGFLFEPPTITVLVTLFGLAGIHAAVQQSIEKSLAAELLPVSARGSGFGVLATVNGIGDLVSSVAVGALWSSVSPAAGFAYAGILTMAGALLIFFFTGRRDGDVIAT